MFKIGLSNIKTTIAVFLCALTYVIISSFNSDFAFGWYTPFFAGLAAAYSIQADRKTSVSYGKNRIVGSIIGGLYGIALILIYEEVMKHNLPHLNNTVYLLIKYAFISFMIVFMINFTVAAKQPGATFVAVLTYLSVTIGPKDGIPNWQFGLNRIISTSYGVIIAWAVNFFTIYVNKNRNSVYILDIDRLVRKGNISGYSFYKLNKLIGDGMKVVFFSSETPGMFYKNCENIKYNLPVIFMNGACVYDFKKMEYLYCETIGNENYITITSLLEKHNVDPFVLEIKHNILYINKNRIDNAAEKNYSDCKSNASHTNYIFKNGNIYDPISVVCLMEIEKSTSLVEELSKLDIISFEVYEYPISGYVGINIYSKANVELKSVDFIKNHLSLDKIVTLVDDNNNLIDKSNLSIKVEKDINKSIKEIGRTFNRKL